MNEKILAIYRSILKFSGLHVEDDGSIYFQLNDELPKLPSTINKEPLVFPVRSQFDNPDQNRSYFHPLSENFLRGESEVITLTRESIATRINYVTALVAQYLIALLATPQDHKQLNGEQVELLKVISEADDNSTQNWSKLIVSLFKSKGDSAFVKIYLKRSGTWKGKDYSRIGVVTFPFYEDLMSETYKPQRVKDKLVFKKIMEFMFPGINKPEMYNYGTGTQIAPYLDALMMTSGNVAQRLNELLDMYEDFIPGAQDLKFDMDWSDYFQDLESLRAELRSTPDLKGNAGISSVQDRKHPSTEAKHQALPPVPAPNKAPGSSISTQPTAQPAQQQVAPVQTVQQAPAVRENERGAINFNDVTRGNPVINHMYNPLAPMPYGGGYGNPYAVQPAITPSGRTSEPSWARPPGQYGHQGMQPQFGVQPMPYGQQVAYPQQQMQQIPPGVPIPPHLLPPGMQPLAQGYAYAYDQMGQFVVIQLQMPYGTMQPGPVHQAPPGWNVR